MVDELDELGERD